MLMMILWAAQAFLQLMPMAKIFEDDSYDDSSDSYDDDFDPLD